MAVNSQLYYERLSEENVFKASVSLYKVVKRWLWNRSRDLLFDDYFGIKFIM